MSNVKLGALPLQHCDGKTYYIGDIHSEADKLVSLLDQVEADLKPEDRVVFLGDLFDRGAQSAKLVDVLVALNRRYPDQIFFVRGNHDWMLQHYLTTGRHDWMEYLATTILDFEREWKLPGWKPEHIAQGLLDRGFNEVLSKLLPYYETEDVIATHATFDQSTIYMYAGHRCMDYKSDYEDWLKGEYPEFRHLMERLGDEIMWQFTSETLEVEGIDKFHICGHQPGSGGMKHPRIFKDRAFIDSGCGKGDRPCTALIYPGKRYLQSK